MSFLDTPVRISHIEYNSYVEGPDGPRTVVFLQGCPIRCPGCQSPHLFDAAGGRETRVRDITNEILPVGQDITILGGEPFFQPKALADLVTAIKEYGGSRRRHVIVYSGYTYEQLMLMLPQYPEIATVFFYADVLVDGPYIAAQNDDFTQWRGSRNQRAIDLQATRRHMFLVEMDWDTRQTITILEDGSILGTKGMIELLAEEGDVIERNRQCGQTKGRNHA
jgi:anaerobic ribonucleoside-triphosphate reductase activating protein